jgi:hypothetical protein
LTQLKGAEHKEEGQDISLGHAELFHAHVSAVLG